jgi:CBS domain-containing protein
MSAPLLSDRLRPFLVEDVMTTPVVTVRPSESLLTAARAMREHHVSGLPVIGPDGKVLGVLSEKDIVRSLDGEVGVGHARGILDLLLAEYQPHRHDLLQRSVAALLNGLVEHAMSRPAVTVEFDAPLGEAWHLLRQYSVNRLPVVRREALVGIITRQDVLEIVESPFPSTAPRAGPVLGR